MKTVLFIILSLFVVRISSFSQNLTVSGKIVAPDNMTIGAAEILLLLDNQLVTSELTTETDNFILKNLMPNPYLLLIKQLGDTLYSRNINLVQSIDLGTITVEPPVKMLGEVTVVSKKPLIVRKVDRLVFNVENSVAATGGDALDALKVTPMVRIQGENISIAGKSSVNVQINDKQVLLSGNELLNYLRSIPSATIQKIEVITNPPAKYDAEGNSGIINIQLKTVKQDNWNSTFRSMYQQANYATFSHGAGFSYRKNRFSALADISYRYGNSLYTNEFTYQYPHEFWENYANFNKGMKNLGSVLNLQYEISKKSSVGAQFLGSFADNNSNELNQNRIYDETDMVKYYETHGVSKEIPNNFSFNLNYNQVIDTLGKKFSIDADFFNALSDKTNSFNSIMNNYPMNRIENQDAINNASQNIKNYSLKTDFDLPFDWANISFGAKVNFTLTGNAVNAEFFNRDNSALLYSQTDKFEYTENVQALYFNLKKQIGERLEIMAGLRAENTFTQSNSITLGSVENNRYFKLFPTAYIMYHINDDNVIFANFGRRIQRPNFGQMNPARLYNTSNSYAEGNPFLQPDFLYLYSLNYAFKELINLELNYIDMKDGFSQLTYHDTGNEIQIFKMQNCYNAKMLNAIFTVNYDFFKWWNISAEFSCGHVNMMPYVDILDKKYSGWQGYTAIQNSLQLNTTKTLLLSLYFEYNLPSKAGYTHQSPSSRADIALKYLLFNRKLTLSLNADDIFKAYQTTNTIYSQNIEQKYRQYYDSRLFRVSVSYNFGNSKINVKQRKIGNQEEKNRSN